jgi:hypothetical protein
MTGLTLPLLIVIGIVALQGRSYWRAMALAGATPVGAAVAVGSTAVPTFYFASLGTVLVLALRALRRLQDPYPQPHRSFPGAVALVVFAAWGILVTFLATAAFPGTKVLTSPAGTYRFMEPGWITSSNVAQIVYLLLGLAVVCYLSRAGVGGSLVVGTTLGGIVALSFWRLLHQSYGLPFPEGFFDNSPAFDFIQTAPGGATRFRGILSEPAGLGTFCITAAVYAFARMRQVGRLRRLGLLAMAAAAVWMGVASTSTTFLLAGAITLTLAVGVRVVSWVRRPGSFDARALGLVVAAGLVARWLVPWVTGYLGAVLDQKATTSSYGDRTSADSYSFSLVLRTWGLGVGLGASRPSSFLAGLVSTTGVIGTASFAFAVVVLVVKAWPVERVRPVLWALAALFVTKLVSGPDLADTSGVLWMCLGVLAGAAVEARSRSADAGLRPVTIREPSGPKARILANFRAEPAGRP